MSSYLKMDENARVGGKKTVKVVVSGGVLTAVEQPPVFDVTAGTQVAQVTGNRLEVAGVHNGSFKTMIQGSVTRRAIVPGVKNVT